MKLLLIGLVALVLSGCTSIDVRPVESSLKIKRVVIRENPKVIVDGFTDVLRDGFDRHGIASEMIAPYAMADGQFVVTYTALRSWDFSPYLSHAEVYIEKDGRRLAHAEYHLRGKGGFSTMKWQSVKTKMDPVIDQLLANCMPSQ